MGGLIAEVVAIGDELTSGERLDTNSQWLSRELTQLGWDVRFHSTVGDDLEAMVEVLRTTVSRSDVVVITGGLGPTADDLTRQALAELTGQPLELRPEALEHIRSLFAHRRREMPPRNKVQAMFPRGCQMVPNPHGTAPGLQLSVPRPSKPPALVFALPGVPAEMQEMWRASVAPALAVGGGPARTIRHYEIKCFGVGESDLEQMLPDLIQRGRQPRVGITASRATITLRITAEGADAQQCLELMQPTIATIRECLGTLIFAEDDRELQDVVIGLLAQRGLGLAVVEAFTGGLLGHWLSAADQDRQAFCGAVVRRAEPSMADKHFCAAQAEVARREFNADLCMVVGAPDPPAMHVPLVLAHRDGVEERQLSLAGHPEIILARTAKQALNALRLWLLQTGPP